jgi:hypothetical protein
VEHLPELRQRFQVVDNYLNVQQDILETFLNRGEIERLSQPTVLGNGSRLRATRTAAFNTLPTTGLSKASCKEDQTPPADRQKFAA